ncbi:MAG: glycoside hydrolase family 127 protein [Candidatus Atribacteria bacterium]|nr:glycoside hydrolase family 127 protein [Candidatus Atribacteria bacterium]
MKKNTNKLKPIGCKNVKIQNRNSFWGKRLQQLREYIVPYQWKVLNDEIPGVPKSHAVENFRIAAGLSTGEFYGMVFQDSDVAKWIEATSYCLIDQYDSALERLLIEVVELIIKAQQPDGYLDTCFIIKEPEKRWANLRDNHELYSAGHMIEAAIAHYQATEKTHFFQAILRLTDHISSKFGLEENKRKGYPGHPEIEMALIKLFRLNQDPRYLKLAEYFINERGKKPEYFELEAEERGEKKPAWPFWSHEYCQVHLPVREQKEAVGHTVRAMYLYSAMADLGYETQEEAMIETCKALWEDVTQRKMYITGGIGSSAFGEAFSIGYDLPPDRAYAETCASIGLVFWAKRMLHLELDNKYADVMEKALYNGILSGISLNGMKYFYANPLGVWPDVCKIRSDLSHIQPTRQPWFDCACCPPNLARLFGSIGQYIYSHDEETISVHLFIESNVSIQIRGQTIFLKQETKYPWDGEITLHIQTNISSEFTLMIRIPGWCKQAELSINSKKIDISGLIEKGYIKLKRIWNNDDHIELSISIPVTLVRAHPNIRSLAGKVAVCKGPIVYCLEEIDNGPNLAQISLPKDINFTPQSGEEKMFKDVVVLHGIGLRSKSSSPNNQLYRTEDYSQEEIPIKMVPYYTWNNRGIGEMTIWVREV